MKWAKLVVIILGALVGLFLIGLGVLLLILSRFVYDPGSAPVVGSVCIVVGVVFLCAVIFRRQIQRFWK